MAVLFPKLYITTDLGSDPIILDNVTCWVAATRKIWTGTYRDTGFDVGRIKQAGALSTGFVANTDSLPVVGENGVMPLDKGLTGLIYTAPDEATHTPPRRKWSWETGYLFAFNNDETIVELPAPEPEPRFASVIVNISTVTNWCSAPGHPFVSGDVVGLFADAAPSVSGVAVAAADRFTVVKADDGAFFLLKSNGAIADFTAAGTSVRALLIKSAQSDPLPAPLDIGAVFVPFAWNPRISTTDPRK